MSDPKSNKLITAIALVWILNLVPFLGLGFLYATGLKGLVLMFFVWIVEMALFKSSISWPVYFALSILGTLAVVLKSGSALTAGAGENDTTATAATTEGDLLALVNRVGKTIDRIDSQALKEQQQQSLKVGDDLSSFALPSMSKKAQEAEKRLADASLRALNDFSAQQKPDNEPNLVADVSAPNAVSTAVTGMDNQVSDEANSLDRSVQDQLNINLQYSSLPPNTVQAGAAEPAGGANTNAADSSVGNQLERLDRAVETQLTADLELVTPGYDPAAAARAADATAIQAVTPDTIGALLQQADSSVVATGGSELLEVMKKAAEAIPVPVVAPLTADGAVSPAPEPASASSLGSFDSSLFKADLGVVQDAGSAIKIASIDLDALGKVSTLGAQPAASAGGAPCPKCGTPRHEGFSFCLNCLSSFD